MKLEQMIKSDFSDLSRAVDKTIIKDIAIGDKIICINPNEALLKGKEYTIEKFSDVGRRTFIRVKEIKETNFFFAHRFIKQK